MNDIHSMISDLTRTHVVQASYTTYEAGELTTRYHYTKAPALLLQLEHATPSSAAEARGAAGFGSRPAAHIEALNTLMHIDKEASAWVRNLGHDDPPSTVRCVTKLGSLYPNADEATKSHIASAVKSWWHQARIATGYDVPAWKPNNTCPLCGKRGTLRVHRIDMTAFCVDCRGVWDEATVSLLADHIRLENLEDGDVELDPDEAA